MNNQLTGHEIIEAALKKAAEVNYHNAPGLVYDADEGKAHQEGMRDAYQHALEMMPASEITALQDEIKRLAAIVDEVHSWAVCGAIASDADMCESLPHIVAITGPAGDPIAPAYGKEKQE